MESLYPENVLVLDRQQSREIYFAKRAAGISEVSVCHLTGLVHYAARDRNL
jgi:hypothetical protein